MDFPHVRNVKLRHWLQAAAEATAAIGYARIATVQNFSFETRPHETSKISRHPLQHLLGAPLTSLILFAFEGLFPMCFLVLS